jgi:hypothetical protein
MLAMPVPFPCPSTIDVVSPTRVFFGNGVYDLTTGARVWTAMAPNSTNGAVAGGFLVEQSGNVLVAEPLPP